MRSSDWSSDVCSSDLARPASQLLLCRPQPLRRRPDGDRVQARHAFTRGSRGLCQETQVHSPLCRLMRRQYGAGLDRSEEHTSELQSLMRISYADFCLKKKKKHKYIKLATIQYIQIIPKQTIYYTIHNNIFAEIYTSI